MIGSYKRILVPTDGSDFSIRSFKRALEIASKENSKIIAVTVIENNFSFGLQYKTAANHVSEILSKEAEENLDALRKIESEEELDVQVIYKSVEGYADKAILEIADYEDVDLIIIGSSGKSMAKRIVGSVAERVVNYANCDVLVIR